MGRESRRTEAPVERDEPRAPRQRRARYVRSAIVAEVLEVECDGDRLARRRQRDARAPQPPPRDQVLKTVVAIEVVGIDVVHRDARAEAAELPRRLDVDLAVGAQGNLAVAPG